MTKTSSYGAGASGVGPVGPGGASNNNNPCLFGPILIQILIQSIDNLKTQDLQLRKHGGY